MPRALQLSHANGGCQQMFRVAKLDAAAQIPVRTHPTDAGYDLHALQDAWVLARRSATVRTGIAVAIPQGYYGRVASRSGLSLKHSLEVGAGVVDAGYRGEIMVRLHNHSDDNVFLAAGDRIAQLVVTAIYTGDMEEVERLDDTERGDRGFGSSGK